MKKIVYTGLLTTLILSAMDVNAGGKAARQERRIARELATAGTTLPTSEIERLADATAHAHDAASRAKDVVAVETVARYLPDEHKQAARQAAVEGRSQDVAGAVTTAHTRVAEGSKKIGTFGRNFMQTLEARKELKARRADALRDGAVDLFDEDEDALVAGGGGMGAGVINYEGRLAHLLQNLAGIRDEIHFIIPPVVEEEASADVKAQEKNYLQAKADFKACAAQLKDKIEDLQGQEVPAQQILDQIKEDADNLDQVFNRFNEVYTHFKAADTADRTERGLPLGPAIGGLRYHAEEELGRGLGAGAGVGVARAAPSVHRGVSTPIPASWGPAATTTTTSTSASSGLEASASQPFSSPGLVDGSSAASSSGRSGSPVLHPSSSVSHVSSPPPSSLRSSSPVPTFRTPPVAMQGTFGHSSAPMDVSSAGLSPTPLPSELSNAFSSGTPMATATAGDGEEGEGSGSSSRSASPTGRVSSPASPREESRTSPRATASSRRRSLPTAGTPSLPSDETLSPGTLTSSPPMASRFASSTSGAPSSSVRGKNDNRSGTDHGSRKRRGSGTAATAGKGGSAETDTAVTAPPVTVHLNVSGGSTPPEDRSGSK